MKKAGKLLLGFAVVAISASVVSAEVSIGAWGRAVFAPAVSNHRGEIVPYNCVSWGGYSGRIGWSIKGNSDNVGFQVDMNADGGGIGFQDQQKIWVKPVEMLTVEVGPSIFYDDLRGNATFGAWNYLRFGGQDDEDAIFFRGKAGKGDASWLRQNAGGGEVFGGALIHLDVSGFHLFTSFDQSKDSPISGDSTEIYTIGTMFKRGQYGAGYEIPNFGLVRAQFIGKAYTPEAGSKEMDDALENKELPGYGIVQAAVKIDKLVENLYVDLGVSIPTEEKKITGDGSHGNTSVAGYIRYGMEKVTIHAMTRMKMGLEVQDKDDDTKMVEGTGIHAGVGADINAGPVTINTDVRFFNNFWLGDKENSAVGFLAGVSKGFSNGRIAGGFEFITADMIKGGWGEYKKEKADDPMWAVPIILEYWF